MPDPSLKFLAKGSAMVPDYSAQANGTRTFIGWTFDKTLGPKQVICDPLSGIPTGEIRSVGAFVGHTDTSTPFEVKSWDPFKSDYIRRCRDDNDLWPADEYTAQVCCRAFDPNFGGEYSEAAKSQQAKSVAEAAAAAQAPPPAPPKKG